MNDELPSAESKYWELEISAEELEVQAQLGEELLLQPFYLPHRVRKLVWHNRIRRQHRQPL